MPLTIRVGDQEIRLENKGKSIFYASVDLPPRDVWGRQFEDFITGLPLVLANKQAVLENERFFFCNDTGAYVSMIPFAGSTIPLGFLLLLWQLGEFTDTCPTCGGQVFLVWAGGSFMSGRGSREGYCETCAKSVKFEGANIHIFPYSLNKLKKQHPIEIVIPGKHQRFDWDKGLVGEATPDIVVKPRVVPASFKEVVEVLGSAG